MGNLIYGTTIQGRTFNDIAIQKSKEGVPRPIVFGVARPIVGNVIATTEPKIITVREEAGGKGGGTEVENQEVFRTYAIRICEGPATVRRVWRNNKLVYDARVEDPGVTANDLGGIANLAAHIAAQASNNNSFRNIATFYTGSFSQMPSPVLEAVFGVGNVPAHRGTCYMVIDNENLSDNGGAIPQYAFEVVRSEGFVLTSKPYPLEENEAFEATPNVAQIAEREVIDRVANDESFTASVGVSRIALRSLTKYQSLAESYESALSVSAIRLTEIVKRLSTENESYEAALAVTGIRVNDIVIRGDAEQESYTSSVAVSAIRVTTL